MRRAGPGCILDFSLALSAQQLTSLRASKIFFCASVIQPFKMWLPLLVCVVVVLSILGVLVNKTSKPKGKRSKENRKKPVRLSIEQKRELIERVNKGESLKDVSNCYSIDIETARRITKASPKINQFALRPGSLKFKAMMPAKFPEMEATLQKWILERRMQTKPLDDSIIKERAVELHEKMNFEEPFDASFGWLRRYKKRFGVRQVDMYGERLSADFCGAATFAGEISEEMETEGYDLSNVYNMDETGCCWRALPTKTLAHAGEKRVDGAKLRKDRFTAAVCANATGTHRLPLLVIGKAAHPRCFKHVTDLPVVYRHQTNAWINKHLFADWVVNVFKPSVETHQLRTGRLGKVMLLVDNCSAHILPPGTDIGDKIKIKFLPPNTTSLIQPMDQGVIVKMKRLFKRKFLQKVINFEGGVKAFYNDYDLKDAVDMLAQSWKELTEENISKAWNKLFPTLPHGPEEGTPNRSAEDDADPDDHDPDDPDDVEEVRGLLDQIAAGVHTEEDVVTWFNEVDEAEAEVFCPEDILSIELHDSDTEEDDEVDEAELQRAFDIVMAWGRRQPTWAKDSLDCVYDLFLNSKEN